MPYALGRTRAVCAIPVSKEEGVRTEAPIFEPTASRSRASDSVSENAAHG